MDKEDYVSPEVAKMLKEKGFPQEYNVGTICRLQNKANPYYENTRIIVQSDIDNAWCIFNEVYPSLYEAHKWLRGKGINVCVANEITVKKPVKWFYTIDLIENCDGVFPMEYYTSYEEALNNGIERALKLI